MELWMRMRVLRLNDGIPRENQESHHKVKVGDKGDGERRSRMTHDFRCLAAFRQPSKLRKQPMLRKTLEMAASRPAQIKSRPRKTQEVMVLRNSNEVTVLRNS